MLLSVLQIAQTYLVYFLDDSANHSTPSIRAYVRQIIAKRGTELEDVKKVERNDTNEEKVEEEVKTEELTSEVKVEVVHSKDQKEKSV